MGIKNCRCENSHHLKILSNISQCVYSNIVLYLCKMYIMYVLHLYLSSSSLKFHIFSPLFLHSFLQFKSFSIPRPHIFIPLYHFFLALPSSVFIFLFLFHLLHLPHIHVRPDAHCARQPLAECNIIILACRHFIIIIPPQIFVLDMLLTSSPVKSLELQETVKRTSLLCADARLTLSYLRDRTEGVVLRFLITCSERHENQ